MCSDFTSNGLIPLFQGIYGRLKNLFGGLLQQSRGSFATGFHEIDKYFLKLRMYT